MPNMQDTTHHENDEEQEPQTQPDPPFHDKDDDKGDDNEDKNDSETSPSPVPPQQPHKNVPPELAVDRICDMLDFEMEHIFWERMARKPHFDCLEWFWKDFPGRHVDKGRRFIRRLMAHMLTHACASHPYGVTAVGDDENNNNKDDDNNNMEPLVKWDAEQWNGFRESLEYLQSLMLRKDATINYISENDVLTDGGVIDKERQQDVLFQKTFPLFMDQVHIHTILAPIRNALEVQARKTGRESIGKKKLTAVCNGIRNLQDGSRVKEALMVLFDQTDVDQDRLLKLKPLSQLLVILQAPPFDFCAFQNSIEYLLHRCNYIVSGGQDCALIKARYTIPPDSTLSHILAPGVRERLAEFSAKRRKNAQKMEKQVLDALRRGRAALNVGHGEDPLEQAVQVAQKAGKKRSSEAADSEQEDEDDNSKKKRKRAPPRLTIVDDIMEDETEDVQVQEEEERETGATLSQVPSRRRRSQPTRVIGQHTIPPDEGIFDERGKVVKRLKWTDEEKMSVKEGVRKHGTGKWKEIKGEYEAILRNRTAVQIKDCWRTMTKHGEV